MAATTGGDPNEGWKGSNITDLPPILDTQVQEHLFWAKVFVISAAVAILIFLSFSALSCLAR